MISRKPRFAHLAGDTCICYSGDGKIITGGREGHINVFKTIEDQYPTTIDYHQAPIVSLACVGTNVTAAVGSDENKVTLHNISNSKSTDLTRFSLSAVSVSMDGSGEWAAACSEDMVIKVINIKSPTQIKLLEGHSAAVRSVAIDPQGKYIASASCDGTVKIWELSNSTCIKTLVILAADNNPSPIDFCRIEWHPEGSCIAVPTGNGISLIERDAWTVSSVLQDSNRSDNVTYVTWSLNGRYVAAVHLNCFINVWDVNHGQSIANYTNTNGLAFTGIAWNPTSEAIALADNNGHIALWEGFLVKPISSLAEAAPTNTLATNTSPFEKKAATVKPTQPSNQISSSSSHPGDAVDSDNDLPVVGNVSSSSKVITDEDNVEDIMAQVKSSTTSPASSSYRHSKEAKSSHRSSSSKYSVSSSQHPPLQQEFLKAQDSFQPGATPANLKRRFMAWNTIGSILSRNDHSSFFIEIRFHNASMRKSIKFTDFYNYTMAYLSDRGAVFASECSSTTQCTIYYRAFESWATSSDWIIQLSDGECVKSVVCGSKWVAAATDKNYLRVFTSSGIQREIISLPGRVIAMASHDDVLLIVFATNPLIQAHEQQLEYMLLNMDCKKQVSRGILPLSTPAHTVIASKFIPTSALSNAASLTESNPSQDSGSQLSSTDRSALTAKLSKNVVLCWLGFTSSGIPIAYDSLGVLRALSIAEYGGSWHVLADLSMQRKNANDFHWIIGVNDQQNQITCVICKGGEKYPPTLPEPILSVVPPQMPVCNPASDVGKFEEKIMRLLFTQRQRQWLKASGLASALDIYGEEGPSLPSQEKEEDSVRAAKVAIDKDLLALIQTACKADRSLRALELCTMLQLPISLSVAAKLAQALHLPTLAQRISLYAQAREENDSVTAIVANDDLSERSNTFTSSFDACASLPENRDNSNTFSTPGGKLYHGTNSAVRIQSSSVAYPTPSPLSGSRKRLNSTLIDETNSPLTDSPATPKPKRVSEARLSDSDNEGTVETPKQSTPLLSKKALPNPFAQLQAIERSGDSRNKKDSTYMEEDEKSVPKTKKVNPFKATASNSSGPSRPATLDRTSSFFDNVRSLSPKKSIS